MEKEGEAKASGSVEENEEVVAAALPPWEQHSAVISIPRFDYKAPTSLLERPHSGFLITCPIKREKSATKEAISILEKYVVSSCGNTSQSVESSDAHATKKRKLSPKETDGEHVSISEEKESALANGSTTSLKSDEEEARGINLSLVKLRKNGLLLFTFPGDDCHRAVDILSSIMHSLEHGDLKPPQWCHRIFPIQETCTLKEKHLSEAVSKLVQKYIDNNGEKLEKPIKFAVGYDRRGLDEKDKKVQQPTANEVSGLDLLDRIECFKIVAKAVKAVVVDSIVDLKSPELIVLIELLPISGVNNGSVIAGVSVLPQKLVSTKPRLCVKALVSDTKARKQKC